MTPCHAARLRCPICGNPDWHDRGEREECTHCGLVVEGAEGLEEARIMVPARLAAGRAEGVEGDRWAMGAWRDAAWRFGHVLDGARAVPATPKTHRIALGMIAKPHDIGAICTCIGTFGAHFARILLAVDAAAVPDGLPARVEAIAHPLDRDFAAQRNRVQAMAGAGWVLQIDSDERPDAALLDALGWLVAAAERDGLVSLGLPRRNLVDGAPSALWPDIQYRLNRAEVRYRGVVHERPDVPFARTALALPGAIEHRLSRARVVERTRVYAAMSADGARREDEARLLSRFDPIAER